MWLGIIFQHYITYNRAVEIKAFFIAKYLYLSNYIIVIDNTTQIFFSGSSRDFQNIETGGTRFPTKTSYLLIL